MHIRKSTKDHHFKWILDELDFPLLEVDEPQTSIHNTLLDINSNGVEALLRIMRTPGYSEGGTDFMFEKYIQVVLTLLFEPEDLLSLGYVMFRCRLFWLIRKFPLGVWVNTLRRNLVLMNINFR